MAQNPAVQIAGMFSSTTIAFGVLTKAVRDHLPGDEQITFMESVIGQLHALAEDRRSNPSVAVYLRQFLATVKDLQEP